MTIHPKRNSVYVSDLSMISDLDLDFWNVFISIYQLSFQVTTTSLKSGNSRYFAVFKYDQTLRGQYKQ